MTTNAIQLQVRSVIGFTVTEVTILGVQRQVARQLPTDTRDQLIAERCIRIINSDEVGRRIKGAGVVAHGGHVGLDPAQTCTDIRRPERTGVEIVDEVQHAGPHLEVRAAVLKLANSAGVVETVSQLTFQTPVAVPLVAKGEFLANIASALDFTIQAAGDINIARCAITQRTADVPTFIRNRHGRRGKDGPNGDCRKKLCFHPIPLRAENALRVSIKLTSTPTLVVKLWFHVTHIDN